MSVTLSKGLKSAMERSASPVGSPSAAGPAGDAVSLRVTERALARVEVLLQREGITDGALRVGLRGGGCAGYEYLLKLESGEPRADDAVIGAGAARVYVDPKSLRLLSGAVLDFTDGLNGRGFFFENPHAVRTCGCGTSFSA